MTAATPPLVDGGGVMRGGELREGVRLTAEQLHALLLGADPEVQLSFIRATMRDKETAALCFMQDHAGAMSYAMVHVCQPRKQPKSRRRRLLIRQGRKP